MKRMLITLALVTVLGAGILAPTVAGTVSAAGARSAPAAAHVQAPPAILDKTRFLIHVGAAFFAFHHWVWNPYKAGAFKSGASGRVKSILKAGIALLFAYHEVKVAYGIAKGSNSKTLQALVAPLQGLGSKMNSIGSKFKSGKYDDSSVNSLNGATSSFGSQASGQGYTITDKSVPIPGL